MRHSDFKRLGAFLFILFILLQNQSCQRDALPSENLNEGSGEEHARFSLGLGKI